MISAGLWASINWFVAENNLAVARAAEEERVKKEREEVTLVGEEGAEGSREVEVVERRGEVVERKPVVVEESGTEGMLDLYTPCEKSVCQ